MDNGMGDHAGKDKTRGWMRTGEKELSWEIE